MNLNSRLFQDHKIIYKISVSYLIIVSLDRHKSSGLWINDSVAKNSHENIILHNNTFKETIRIGDYIVKKK